MNSWAALSESLRLKVILVRQDFARVWPRRFEPWARVRRIKLRAH